MHWWWDGKSANETGMFWLLIWYAPSLHISFHIIPGDLTGSPQLCDGPAEVSFDSPPTEQWLVRHGRARVLQ